MQSAKKIYYIYGRESEDFVTKFKEMEGAEDISFVLLEEGDSLPILDISKIEHFIVSGTTPQIKIVLEFAQESDLSIGLIPLPQQSRFAKILDMPLSPLEAFAVASRPSDKRIDMLYCNGHIVIDDMRIGNRSVLKEFEFYYPRHSFFKRIELLWQTVRQKSLLKHYTFTVNTDKDNSYTFSALGMIILGYNNFSWIGKVLRNRLSAMDGQQTLLVLSPTSLFQYFISNPFTLFIHKWRAERIPASWGYMKSAKMEISSVEPVKVVLDDLEIVTTPIVVETKAEALRLSVGEKFWDHQVSQKSDRSSIKLDSVPKDQERMAFFHRGIPLFRHASTEQYSALFTNLRNEGSVSRVFVVLLILATVIATLGLFINSSSVIIGAMLLAPLMQPIVSLSMGVLRQDEMLCKSALRTVLIGMMITLMTAMLVAYLTPIRELSSEMASRLSPTLLDMLVAIASGVAAAYVKNDEKILSSLAGVAIAVALVPPLAVSGIGLGWGEWSMFMQSLLLFITNLIGIVLAGSITFLVLGYAPIKVAKKGIFVWAMIAVLVTVPLYHSFETMRERSDIERVLSQVNFDINEKSIYLSRVDYRSKGDGAEVRCEVVLSQKLQKEEREYLHHLINKVVGRPTEVIVTFRYRL
ncbi:MAG: TIGR00341 family protein [Campylobacterota bacterium]|nr:TIGR00341 family protein [Campylobacterota bacterium]